MFNDHYNITVKIGKIIISQLVDEENCYVYIKKNFTTESSMNNYCKLCQVKSVILQWFRVHIKKQ